MSDLIPLPSTIRAGDSVWAYLRDSGGDNQEQSVTQQERVVFNYCAQNGLNLARIFTDKAKSGTNDKRDQFLEMIDSTAQPDKRPKAIIVWSLSRFSRNQNDAPYYRALLRKRGVTLHSLTDMIPDDPSAPIIEAVYDFRDADFSRRLKRDIKRALHDRVKSGYIPGTPPRGYKLSTPFVLGTKRNGDPRKAHQWEIDDRLAPLVTLAFKLKREGKGHRAIQYETRGKLYKSKHCWSTFFRNKAYIGILVYGGIEYPNIIPPLIDRETWETVQEINKARTQPRDRHQPNRGAISGLTFCSYCGSAMQHGKNKSWRFYLCGKKNRQGATACTSRRIGADLYETKILDRVIGRIFTPDMIGDLIAEVEAQLSDTKKIDQEIDRLQREIAEVKRWRERLNEQIELYGASPTTGEKLKQRDAEIVQMQIERAEWQARKASNVITVTPEALAFVFNLWRSELDEARKANDLEAMQNLLKRFVKRIEADYNHITITYCFALNEQRLTAQSEELIMIERR